MKPVTSQHFPTHKHTRTLPASNAARMACLVLAVIVALAQPIQAQNEPPDTQQIRTELGKVVTDLRAAMAQLARIEVEAAALPKTFTAGGQTQNRWNQLNGEKERWTTEQNNALERYDQLVVRSEPLPPGNAAIADLLTICTQLLARNDVMLKTAQSKLSGIERTLRSGPSTFAKGNEIEVWQTQLNRERDYLYRTRLIGHRIGVFRQLRASRIGKQYGLQREIGSGVFRGASGGCRWGRRWRRRRGVERGFCRSGRG